MRVSTRDSRRVGARAKDEVVGKCRVGPVPGCHELEVSVNDLLSSGANEASLINNGTNTASNCINEVC